MNKADTVVVGNLVDSPRMNRTGTGSPVTNFRVASTRRRFDQQTQDWVDGNTLWLDVEVFGDMAGNVARSLVKGDPVVVTGELYTHSWETEAGRRQSPRLRAESVGPDLARGWADFRRSRRPDETDTTAAEPADLSERSTAYDRDQDPLDDLDLDVGGTTGEPGLVPALA